MDNAPLYVTIIACVEDTTTGTTITREQELI